ncbi:MAG: glycoside hydrolase family 2, partial [Clostridia bacterium]|nr:glycoside hydrolase family 2 [Clostridia bacterium]
DFRSIHTYRVKLKTPPKKDKRTYLISEYGGYNFIDKDHLWRDDDVCGYVYFKSTEELMEAYEKLVTDQVIPLIKKGLCGVIYTQLSDVEIETNGIYTYDRKVLKFNPERTGDIHKKVYEAFNKVNQ